MRLDSQWWLLIRPHSISLCLCVARLFGAWWGLAIENFIYEFTAQLYGHPQSHASFWIFIVCPDWLRSMHLKMARSGIWSKRNTFLPVKNYSDNRFQRGMTMAVTQANSAFCPLFTSSLQANQHSSMYVGLFHTGYDDLWCKIIWILNIDCATVGHFRLTTLPPCWDRHQSTSNAELTECHFRTTCTRRGIFSNTMILRSLTQILSWCASAAVKDFSGMLCETD